MCGGFTAPRAPTETEIKLAAQHKGDVEKLLGKSFTKWEVVAAKSQVVAGTNHDLSIDAGSEFVQVRIFEPLPQAAMTSRVSYAQGGHTKDDALNCSSKPKTGGCCAPKEHPHA